MVDAGGKWRALGIVAVAELLGMALWFGASAVGCCEYTTE